MRCQELESIQATLPPQEYLKLMRQVVMMTCIRILKVALQGLIRQFGINGARKAFSALGERGPSFEYDRSSKTGV